MNNCQLSENVMGRFCAVLFWQRRQSSRACCRTEAPRQPQAVHAEHVHQKRGETNNAKHANGKQLVIDEQADKTTQDFANGVHRAISPIGRRNIAARLTPVAKKIAPKTTIAMSTPGQLMPRPSPVQEAPNAESITPTHNLSVFSGTRDKGL
jgi:hypothetical protein